MVSAQDAVQLELSNLQALTILAGLFTKFTTEGDE